jgi:ectoine hydroxylase-related dioxygenase (phytanoyl-CoA dioxygenase family)
MKRVGIRAALSILRRQVDSGEKLRAAKKAFDRDGVAVISSVFTREECDKIRGSALVALTKSNAAYPHQYIEFRNPCFPALLFWPSLTHEYLDAIRKDERMANIVRFFLGDDVKQLNNQVYFRLPGDGDEFSWHRDIRFRKPKARYPGIQNAYLQTIIAVDDITVDNGAVEFIRGSHLGDDWDRADFDDDDTSVGRRFSRNNRRGTKYICNSGDVMVWSVMTLHGSERNRSDRMRMTYMNGFAKADAALDWPHYLRGGRVVDIDPSAIP